MHSYVHSHAQLNTSVGPPCEACGAAHARAREAIAAQSQITPEQLILAAARRSAARRSARGRGLLSWHALKPRVVVHALA